MAALAPGIAPQDAPGRQRTAADSPIALQGLQGWTELLQAAGSYQGAAFNERFSERWIGFLRPSAVD